jgi:maleate isomerase
VIEPEFNAMKPDGVSIHSTRLLLTSGDEEGLKRMAVGVETAAQLLSTAMVDIIVYACTTGSLVKHFGWDQVLIRRIEETTHISATTTSTAVIRAFKELGISKVAVASPYSQEINRLEKEFFEAHNVKVVNMIGLDLHGEKLGDASPEMTHKLALEVNVPEAEAVFISCTAFKSIAVIRKLEEELKKCVFSSNTATMWDVLKRLKIGDPIKGYGTLFEHSHICVRRIFFGIE